MTKPQKLIRFCYYCHNNIAPGNPFITYETEDFHISCFAKFESELLLEKK